MKDGVELVAHQLEFLAEPALVLDLAGNIHGANSAAHGLLDLRKSQANLFDFLHEPSEGVTTFLRRASGSTSPLLGAIMIAGPGAPERFRTHAARGPGGRPDDPLLILRLMPAREDQFSILNRRLRELNQNLHQRLRENALLKESLAQNKLLARELQHRVKNSIQQMASLIRMSASSPVSPEVAGVIRTATDRLQAMAMAQEALYRSVGAGNVSAQAFLGEVVRRTASSYGASGQVEASIADERVTSEEAHCLSLIANELVTNACKYGLVEPDGRVSVSFAPVAEGLHLEVRDNGPGFDEETIARSSGLMLVRGLCRQIGARLDVTRDRGTRCSVWFKSECAPGENEEVLDAPS